MQLSFTIVIKEIKTCQQAKLGSLKKPMKAKLDLYETKLANTTLTSRYSQNCGRLTGSHLVGGLTPVLPIV